MAKFVFKMEKVLSIKKQLEESIKNELGKALKELQDQKDILWRLQDQKKDYIDNIKESMIKGISVQKMREFNAFISSFENKINNQKKVVNDVQLTADKIREELVKIMKEKKILETLREKKLEEFKLKERKQEELALGEVASYNYIERKVGEDNGS